MTVCRSFFLFLMLNLIHSNLSRAEFVELPKVPDFSEVQTYEEAMHRLFRGSVQDLKEISTVGAQINRAYTAVVRGVERFIKIVREDCGECNQIRFEYEWLLKMDLPLYGWLNSVNAELVLPHRAATFVLNDKQHYILSYPLVEGETLEAFYYKRYLGSPYVLNTKQETLLKRAFYRYGQVLALSHFDPQQPAKSSNEMLSRAVRLHLPDRNGSNEIYNPESDRIYLVDLADTAEDFGEPVKVGVALEGWFGSFVERASFAVNQEGFYCGLNYDCVVSPVKQFALGYASSLPLYKRAMVMDVIRSTMIPSLKEECDNEMEEESFCPAVEMIEQQIFND